MPQSTNLNKSPYFDDFSEDKNYYKVLFKPGTTVQARELTTLQSTLQNQIEKFGKSFYTSGGVVIPGASSYDANFTCVEVESTYKGIDVESYYENLIGVEIKGKVTGITAKVIKVLSREESIRDNTTLYVKYVSSSGSSDDNAFIKEVFDNGEELITLSDISVGESFIFTNSEFAKTISPINRECTSIGSAAVIDEGVYFIRGYFVGVESDTIILDQYSNTPSYRVGLEVTEEIIDSDEDPSLNDNAQGFSNFAAPGADRLKITLTLVKKSLDDFNDDSFVELFRVVNGTISSIKKDDRFSFIDEILARRTYDESGNYYTNPFDVEAIESLDNDLGNGGFYSEGQITQGGSTPSDNLGILKVSPGKAYVKGFEVPLSGFLVDYPKPRTTKTVESSSATFYGGDLVRVNNVKGSPKIGLTTTYSVSLLDKRLENQVAVGDTIGFARVYNFESHNTSFVNPSSRANLYLFDIQTFSNLTLSSSIATLSVGSYVRGKNSGATGYVKSVSGVDVKLYQVSGTFFEGETLIVNGFDVAETILEVKNYSIEDVKSIFSDPQVSLFVADTVLSKKLRYGSEFTAAVGSGIATITSNDGSSFATNLKVNDVLSFSRTGSTSPIFVGVTSIFPQQNKINVVGLSTVQGVCSGDIGDSVSYRIIDLKLIKSQIVANSENSSLYAQLNNSDIANVDTINSNIYVKKQYNNVVKSSTTLTLPTLNQNFVYSSFDEERYVIVNANGSLENLTTATFTRTNGNRDAEFTGLSSTSGPCSVITTQIKSNVSHKFKKLNRCSSIVVDRTRFSPPSNGLTTSTVYGTRIDDVEISLNYPDIIEVHGIFESTNSSTPTSPWLSLSGISSPGGTTSDLIVGELIIGQSSGSVAIYAENKTTNQIYIIYKNGKAFLPGEEITFKESGYTATILTINVGSTNITNDFKLDNGQRKHFYDFGRLKRRRNAKVPSYKIKVYFDRFSYDSTDNGDLITVNSYPSSVSKSKIAKYNNIRNLDTIDLRPRVFDYNTSSTISPFEFGSRNFSESGLNAEQILSPNEDVVFDYSFYLPRYDKLTISTTGSVDLVQGSPSENPQPPKISPEVFDLATIEALPYVYNIDSDVSVTLTNNKRYTMSDLRDIESRVESLEVVTSLSLLESTTKNLLIEDADGLNRFKSGFFVDPFRSYRLSDTDDLTYRAIIKNNSLTSPTKKNIINLSLYSDDSQNSSSEINLSNTNSNNLKLTGNSLTLDYDPVVHVSQPFASRTINVNPYKVVSWSGILDLNPNSDSWSINTTKTERRRERGEDTIVTSIKGVDYLRSRNIEFVSSGLKPNTKYRLLFDSRDLTSKIDGFTNAFPKLLQITDVNGSFTIGETVTAYTSTTTSQKNKICTFRICTPNHKFGPHNSPEVTYTLNPYNNSNIPTSYGPQSTILNVDTSSLQVSNISQYYGNIIDDCILVGSTSGATAKVSDLNLISDVNGSLIGSIFIPDPSKGSLKFKTGTTPVKVVQFSSSGETGKFVSSAEANFVSSGSEIRTTKIDYYDPIAQSFLVSDENGIIPSSVDIYFSSKDVSIPVTLQIREVINGTPGGPDKIVGNLQKLLNPSDVKVSSDGSAATRFTFDNLTRLEGGREYAIVLLSDSFDYDVWTSRLGEVEISTAKLPATRKVIINSQPSLGSLFKSQNGTTWTEIQTDDLKFTLNKCKFSTAGGTARFYNSKVEVEDVENFLPENPISVEVGGSAPDNGFFMQINHPNHGLNSANNKVTIRGVSSDILPTTLTADYEISSTAAISIASTSNFGNFQGSAVSPANPGYVLINDEIIRYEGVSSGQLTSITRSIQSTPKTTHPNSSLVYKYEFNGVSLIGINTTHTISSTYPPGLNTYYIEVPSQFTSTKYGGGDSVYATGNKLYNTVEIPSEFVSIFNGTNCSPALRSISAKSADGSEIAFADQGYSSLSLTRKTEFNTIRMVASEQNENEFLNATQFPGNKSLTLDLNLNTLDINVSPIINIDKSFLTVENYIINKPIGENAYPTDNRVNSNLNDPHRFIHITNRVDLIQSANSLKVLFDSYRPAETDIRVLYKVFKNDSPDEDQVWNLFPGYSNLDVNGNVKNESDNNGSPDKFIPSSLLNQYLEYEFTKNDISDFTGFQIKIVCSSTSQAVSPIIKNLRVIALK